MNIIKSELLEKYGVGAVFSADIKFSFDFKTNSKRAWGNYRKLAEQLGISERKLITAEQVHGIDYKWVTRGAPLSIKNVDALISQDNAALGIITADCLPIFMYEPNSCTVAAIHSGWRGTYSEITLNVLNSIAEKTEADFRDFIVSIGPGICGKCYNVSPELYEKFKMKFGNVGEEQYQINLRSIIYRTLIQSGLKKENIENIDLCTFEGKKEFFSFRRNKTEKRMLNLIWRAS